MTSPFLQFFENVNLFPSYDGLSPHQIWLNLDEGKQSYGGGGGADSAPPVENVLNRPGEIGLSIVLHAAPLEVIISLQHTVTKLSNHK